MSTSIPTTSIIHTFPATDLFAFSDHLDAICAPRGWSWTWHQASSMTEMAHILCETAVEVDMSFKVEVDGGKEKMRFQVSVGDFVIAVGGEEIVSAPVMGSREMERESVEMSGKEVSERYAGEYLAEIGSFEDFEKRFS